MRVTISFAAEMCPWLLPAKSDQEMQMDVLATIERLNMTIVAYDDPQILHILGKSSS